MSETGEQARGDLVPTGERGLARRSAALAARGLKDIVRLEETEKTFEESLKKGEAQALRVKVGWPLWDGKESVADYAKRVGLPATKDLNLNGVKLEMVLIPAGKFTMGSPEGEARRSKGEKQHEVTLSTPYYMGKYEVMQAQWEAVL